MRITLNNHLIRRALSLMEVIFAIGILMVGLLGIASILPVATKNAAGALRIDAGTTAVENQIANALGRFDGVPNSVDMPLWSLKAANATPTGPPTDVILSGIDPEPPLPPKYATIPSGSLFNANIATNGLGAYCAPGSPTVASLCIDPAFLNSASNLRDDTNTTVDSRNLNYYDRTKFPCYDWRYDPTTDPGAQMKTATSWNVTTPRMLRVSVPLNGGQAVATDAVSRSVFTDRDGFPLSKSKDKTIAPSRLFSRFDNTDISKGIDVQPLGKYSSLVTFVPTDLNGSNWEVSVVVFEGRDLLQFDADTLTEGFSLAPFSPPSPVYPLPKANTNVQPKTYGGEVLGIVTAISGDAIRSGIGRFQFIHSDTCNPEITTGQWVLLCRRDRGLDRFAWFRVSEVLSPPARSTASPFVYTAEIEVRGPDWFYSNDMIDATNGNVIAYPNPITNASARANATYIIKCPRVVTVRTFVI